MNEIVIRVEALGKRYRIGQRQKHRSLRDALVDAVTAVPRRLFAGGRRAAQNDHIWALQDVSFEVRQGEVMGIIGRNGAGKSTLLKILSRITKPTTGCARIRGRVGSLLEVGTGFHPELTGRENIYLNGAVLGMKRAEIDRKFDEIVAFAEVETFLDTPVKRYSSGMYVRLAFAVAAYLEPEILIVDEVLAVGDAAFQKKCLGKMSDVASEGRTVLFVSHNMSAIRRLCSRTILLERGQLVADGDTAAIVHNYLTSDLVGKTPASWIDVSQVNRRGNGKVYVHSVWYSSGDGTINFRPFSMGPLEIKLAIIADMPRAIKSIAVALYDQHGTKMVNADTVSLGQIVNLRNGCNVVQLRIEKLYLNSGVYSLGWWIADPLGVLFDQTDAVIEIEVFDRESKGLGMRPYDDGAVICDFQLLDTFER